MSIAEKPTQINTEIDAARARWAEKLRRAAEEQAKIDAHNAAIAAAAHRQLQARMAQHLPTWMLEYVQPTTDIDPDSATELIEVRLPGCCPIVAIYDFPRGNVTQYIVDQPLRIVEDEGLWWVKCLHERADDLDQAVDMAASYGESWHEMFTEASRRNELGITPAVPDVPPTPLEIARVAADNGQLDAATWALLAIADKLQGIIDELECRP